jgi:hypothetical protein
MHSICFSQSEVGIWSRGVILQCVCHRATSLLNSSKLHVRSVWYVSYNVAIEYNTSPSDANFTLWDTWCSKPGAISFYRYHLVYHVDNAGNKCYRRAIVQCTTSLFAIERPPSWIRLNYMSGQSGMSHTMSRRDLFVRNISYNTRKQILCIKAIFWFDHTAGGYKRM